MIKKGRNGRNFWTGACAPREGESPKGGFPVHWEIPSEVGPRGAVGISESWAKQGPRGAETEKAALLAHKQPKDYGPGQMAGMGNQEKPTETPFHRVGGPGTMREAQHTNLFREHRPCRTEGGPGDWKEHRPCSTEGGPGELKQAHERLGDAGGQDQGAEASPHKSVGFRDEEGRVKETGKDPRKPLPSKLQPAEQGRARGQKHWQRFQGPNRGWLQ